MNDDTLSKEQRILRALRKVLANIVKDATPAPGMPHPLKESTIYDIRDLFGLISEREAELANESAPDRNEKPFYADEPKKSNVIKMPKPAKKKTSEDE
ncbi:MAG TPA: segregation and condensation protein A [Gallionellaceae bacterium]|nr:segregation and condensation protein A [Gallionellaceae bacterium]